VGLNPAEVLVGSATSPLIGGAATWPNRVVCSIGSSSMIFMALAPEQQAADPAGRLYVYPRSCRRTGWRAAYLRPGASLVWLRQQFSGAASSISFEMRPEGARRRPGSDSLVFIPPRG
jgi:hypothetical protein